MLTMIIVKPFSRVAAIPTFAKTAGLGKLGPNSGTSSLEVTVICNDQITECRHDTNLAVGKKAFLDVK